MKILSFLFLSFPIFVDQVQAATYKIELSGTSFSGTYQDGGGQALLLSTEAEGDLFEESFVAGCLEQVQTQFTPEFCTATNEAGVSYRAFILEQDAVKDRLKDLSDWILEINDLNGVNSPDETVPEAHFLVTEGPAKCMHLAWNNTLPNQPEFIVEFIVNVRKVQD